MEIRYGRRFAKRYRKLDLRSRDAVDRAIVTFCSDPHHPSLRNHALKGEFAGLRSIDAAFDLRIILSEEDGYTVVIFLDVGSHSQIYG